jgi:dihydroneopterin aldolase
MGIIYHRHIEKTSDGSERQIMEEEETTPKQALMIRLAFTAEESAAMMAACLHYIHYAKRHPELNLQEAANLLEDLQRKLVEQARAQGGHDVTQ